jgi:Cys-rich protein (TIGR01571 family)
MSGSFHILAVASLSIVADASFVTDRHSTLRGGGSLEGPAAPSDATNNVEIAHRPREVLASLGSSLRIARQPLVDILEAKETSKGRNLLLANGVELAVSLFIWIAFVVGIAHFYKNSEHYTPEFGPKPSQGSEDVQEEMKQWQVAWYQCFQDPRICLWSFCCPCIRWAHTMDLAGFLDFWPAFIIFCMLAVLNQLTVGIAIGFFFSMMLAFYRQKMRKLFNMDNQGTCTGYVEDFMCYCFCSPCAIAQEAQQVKLAAEKGWTKALAPARGLFSSREPT